LKMWEGMYDATAAAREEAMQRTAAERAKRSLRCFWLQTHRKRVRGKLPVHDPALLMFPLRMRKGDGIILPRRLVRTGDADEDGGT